MTYIPQIYQNTHIRGYSKNEMMPFTGTPLIVKVVFHVISSTGKCLYVRRACMRARLWGYRITQDSLSVRYSGLNILIAESNSN